MQLSYRGVHYHYQPTPVDLVDSGISGRYRGQKVNFTYPRHVPLPQPVVELTYRGVTYRTTASGGVEPVALTDRNTVSVGQTVPLPLASQVRRLTNNGVIEVHRQNIQRRLQHRIEVAKTNGDESLLRQLEHEMQLFI
ncbi:MAG: DUF4278 domain-containing protein [Cyanobacteria bacterium CRU_2_1]|nr:DUF4278 domain-containing protein [Cyanobacteria bacterium RU_5_0]NJR63799.1 DUF4278 domain-containing protein [Cyanobacteria bacterium CRU_2_1]